MTKAAWIVGLLLLCGVLAAAAATNSADQGIAEESAAKSSCADEACSCDHRRYTLLIGDMLQAGTSRTEPYNHYSLLRSVEANFHLGTLGRNTRSPRRTGSCVPHNGMGACAAPFFLIHKSQS